MARLSVRERSVAEGVTQGGTLKVIASQLGISLSTTATYLARARRKLGQSSRWKFAIAVSSSLPQFCDLVCRRAPFSPSPTEIQLGELILAGLSNAEIARVMNIDAKAAAHRVERLLRKTGFGTRSDLIAVGRHDHSARSKPAS